MLRAPSPPSSAQVDAKFQLINAAITAFETELKALTLLVRCSCSALLTPSSHDTLSCLR